jgi:hypothetical protein
VDAHHIQHQAEQAIIRKAEQQRIEEVRKFQEEQARRQEQEARERALAAESRRRAEQSQQMR